MFNDYIKILGIDEETKTILAQHHNGSITLDAIPDAVSYMRLKTGYTMLFKDFYGAVFEITPESTVQTAEVAWQQAKQIQRNANQQKNQILQHAEPAM